ncbi:MAG TPA: GGDEF domain-containing protein [Candidatus Acidoferrum sp.]|nr:GGDEF domain-containing protein [Candidatus Acidoferrum sp.]
MSAEDAFLDLLIETLQSLDRGVRGLFLQKLFKTLAQVDLNETMSLDFWEQILARRRELSESLHKPVSLQTALVDVLASNNLLRMPILMEYEELKKLQINAATDALTGLYNRRLFEEYFLKELNRSRRHNQHLALVIMDLHCFKDVNDRHGHMEGDHVLQLAASTLRKTLRTSDYAFRIGGDEFALLLPFADPAQASTLARRVRTNYQAALEPLKLSLSLSIDYGVAVFPEDGESREVLIQLADERLYELKNASRSPAPAAQPVLPRASAPPFAPPSPPATPRVIPMEPPAAREPANAAAVSAGPLPAAALPAAAPAPAIFPSLPAARGGERRKWERVSLVGTRAHAVIGDDGKITARVLDMSYGGVALLVDSAEELPSVFPAVLHVPILPPVKVSLRRAYFQQIDGQKVRIGCAFLP